jgi:hypothetical protein
LQVARQHQDTSDQGFRFVDRRDAECSTDGTDPLGALRNGARGLGFGCGQEPLPPVFAKCGAKIVATDLPPARVSALWDADRYGMSIDGLNRLGICPDDTFRASVATRHVDMNAIPDDLRGFDFVWSSCALEHLGSLEHGVRYILRSLDCLRPGGMAVHTTEFNVSSEQETLEEPNCVIYRKSDIEDLIRRCQSRGVAVSPVNWCCVAAPVDEHVSRPSQSAPHLKVHIGGHLSTSLGLIFTRLA